MMNSSSRSEWDKGSPTSQSSPTDCSQGCPDRPGIQLFYLVPENYEAKNTVTSFLNSKFRATGREEQNIGRPALCVGLLPSRKGANILITLGRKGDIVVEGEDISDIHCFFKIKPETGAVMLHDRSDHATTYVYGHEFRNKTSRRVVVTPGKFDIIYLGRHGRLKFKLTWCDDIEEALKKGKDLILSRNPHAFTMTRRAKSSPKREINKWVKAGTLGSGKFAIVHRVIDLETGEMMALKTLNRSEHWANWPRQSARAEAKILAKLNHTHIVKLISSNRSIKGSAEIFMRMEEGNVESLLNNTKRVANCAETEQCLKIGKTVMKHMLKALTYLDQKGIVHCDVKPRNILYRTRPDGRYHFVLADFGLSKRLSLFSFTHTEAGSHGFMAPEVFDRYAKTTHKVDVWALYVTLLWIFDVNGFRENYLKFKTQDEIHDLICDIASSKKYPLIRPFRRMASRNPENRVTAKHLLKKWPAIEWTSFNEGEISADKLLDSWAGSSKTLVEPALQRRSLSTARPLQKYEKNDAPPVHDILTVTEKPKGEYEYSATDFGAVEFGGPRRTLDLRGVPRRDSRNLQSFIFEKLYRVV